MVINSNSRPYFRHFYDLATFFIEKKTRHTTTNIDKMFKSYWGKVTAVQSSVDTFANVLKCIELANELKNMLYNWLVGNVDQQTVEHLLCPNKGDRHAALELLKKDLAVIAHKLAGVKFEILAK
jgi:hypothetical protein